MTGYQYILDQISGLMQWRDKCFFDFFTLIDVLNAIFT
jgi:hypothetical protein